jgi:hypothetical protein
MKPSTLIDRRDKNISQAYYALFYNDNGQLTSTTKREAITKCCTAGIIYHTCFKNHTFISKEKEEVLVNEILKVMSARQFKKGVFKLYDHLDIIIYNNYNSELNLFKSETKFSYAMSIRMNDKEYYYMKDYGKVKYTKLYLRLLLSMIIFMNDTLRWEFNKISFTLKNNGL